MSLDYDYFAGGRFYNWWDAAGKWVLSREGRNRKRKRRLNRVRSMRASWEIRQLLVELTRRDTEAEEEISDVEISEVARTSMRSSSLLFEIDGGDDVEH